MEAAIVDGDGSTIISQQQCDGLPYLPLAATLTTSGLRDAERLCGRYYYTTTDPAFDYYSRYVSTTLF